MATAAGRKRESRRAGSTKIKEPASNFAQGSSPRVFDDVSGQLLQERIAKRAYELYEQRGREPGHELDDWLTAEREVRKVAQEGHANRVDEAELITMTEEDDMGWL